MIEKGKYLVCSLGLVDSNPSTVLKTLVDNEDTNRILYIDIPDVGRQIKYSKSLGTISKIAFSIPALGTFLTNLDPRGTYLGYNLQDGLRALGYPRSLYFTQESNPKDFVYIPLSIQDRQRPYFVQTIIDNNPNPVWRIILPVAFSSKDMPLADLADALRNSDKDAWKAFYGIKFDPFLNPSLTKIGAWMSMSETPTSQFLRKKLIEMFGVSEDAAMRIPDLLKPQFTVTFLPSIINGELNHAAFRHDGTNSEIILPIVSQTWRIGADVVHELTHALQTPCGPNCTDDRRFEMEMEAHTNERQHLKEMIAAKPSTKFADDAFNYLVAASLPKVEWADHIQNPLQRTLCEDVILGYGLDPQKITVDTMKKFNCQLQPQVGSDIKRRIQ